MICSFSIFRTNDKVTKLQGKNVFLESTFTKLATDKLVKCITTLNYIMLPISPIEPFTADFNPLEINHRCNSPN